MGRDITLKCDDGFINIRVGAIILKDNRFLMTGNKREDYLYSVGGRIKFGETAKEAVIREVFEETGDFEPVSKSFTDDGCEEFLKWVSFDEEMTIYPEFFRTELKHPQKTVKHMVTDERDQRPL